MKLIEQKMMSFQVSIPSILSILLILTNNTEEVSVGSETTTGLSLKDTITLIY